MFIRKLLLFNSSENDINLSMFFTSHNVNKDILVILYETRSPKVYATKVPMNPWFFILDGCSFHVAHVLCKQGLFPKKKEFYDSFDVTKCLQQIEMHDLLHMSA